MTHSSGRARDAGGSATVGRGSRGVARGLVAFLKNTPSSNEVAEELVLRCLAHLEARSAIIMMAGPDGSLVSSGSFGSDHEFAQSSARVSYWDPLPVAAAFRSEETILLPTAESVLEQFPVIEDLGWHVLPCAVFPLVSPTRCMGVVSVAFGSELTELARVAELVSDIADAISLYFHTVGCSFGLGPDGSLVVVSDTSARSSRPHAAAHHSPTGPGGEPQLTSRQGAILRLLSEGMTNAQIASRIGFSESTVRHETMAIFEVLGVAGRHEAVDTARVHGLLDEPSGSALP